MKDLLVNKFFLGVIAAGVLTLVGFEYQKQRDVARLRAEDEAYKKAFYQADRKSNEAMRQLWDRKW